MTRKTFAWFLLAAVAALLMVTCSDDDSPVAPSDPTTTVAGAVDFPANVSPAGLKALVGGSSAPISSDGTFSLTARAGAPACVMVAGTDTLPMLLAVIPRPETAGALEVNVHSTALALALLDPFVASSTSDYTEFSRSILLTLPELTQLEQLLASRIAVNPRAICAEDISIDNALRALVTAYFNALPTVQIPGGLEKPSAPTGEIIIIPDYIKSGHQLSYVQNDRFAMTNWYGRWAYCATPNDSFYLFPNGTFLDILKGSKPWAASRREFNMPLPTAQQSRAVNVYGFGWAPGVSNSWDSLTAAEQTLAMYGGLSSIFLEFVPHVVSVLTNTGKLTNTQLLPKTDLIELSTWILKYARVGDRIREYAKAKNFSGAMWFVTKQYIAAIVNDDEFRSQMMRVLGITITEGMIRTLAGWLHVPAKAALTFDAVTSAGKTFFGATGSRFKTSFEVSWEETDFGKVAGTVHDKTSGLPLSGVTVKLKGDEGNPLNPNHEVTTGSSGGFYFENITAGAKTLEASKPGYGSTSKQVTVQANSTVNVTMELSAVKGRLTGKVLNKIFIDHRVTPTTFRGECNLEVTPVAPAEPGFSYWINNGSYAVDLAGGTYRVIAWHEDYVPDTVSVTVQAEGITTAPDLVLRPDGYLRGTIYLDMDNNGSYEQQYQVDQKAVGAGWNSDPGTCPDNLVPHALIYLGGTSIGTSQDVIIVQVNPVAVQEAGYYTLGGLDMLHCSNTITGASMLYTSRVKCTEPSSGMQAPMSFHYMSDPDFLPCNCGITDPGSLVLESFDTTMTGVLKGAALATMAGYTTCSCAPDSVKGCARAYMNVEFKMLMGSLAPGSGMLKPRR